MKPFTFTILAPPSRALPPWHRPSEIFATNFRWNICELFVCFHNNYCLMSKLAAMKFLKEPLFHFLLLGGAIFAVHAWRQPDETAADGAGAQRIEVNAAAIKRLREGWTRQFQRAPNAEDMQALVEAHIKEEVLYREALAMGLDREDTIVRRRMAQKMEFLTQDISMAATPDDAALEQFFMQHAARYAQPAQVSFRHVYFSKERRGAKLEADARETLAALAKPGASDEAFGDPFLHGYTFTEHREQDVTGIFGSEFAAVLMKSPSSAWTGPVTSSYGLHLVLVTERGASQPVTLTAVRDTVLRDLLEERRLTVNADVVAGLRKNYEIVIDAAALEAAASSETTLTAQKNP